MIEKVMELYKEKTAKECYKIEVVDGTPDIMDDKIGGTPYLPVGEEYPLDENGEPMVLVAQINLENIELKDYPGKGILEIFIDKECSWPCNYKVMYFDEVKECREDLPEVDLKGSFLDTPLKIKLTKDTEYMPICDYRFMDTMIDVIKEATDVELDTYGDIDDFFGENEADMYDELGKLNMCSASLSGYANFTQDDPRPIKGSEDKTECLVKIDSMLGHGIMIGDTGIIFSFVSEEE